MKFGVLWILQQARYNEMNKLLTSHIRCDWINYDFVVSEIFARKTPHSNDMRVLIYLCSKPYENKNTKTVCFQCGWVLEIDIMSRKQATKRQCTTVYDLQWTCIDVPITFIGRFSNQSHANQDFVSCTRNGVSH